jgi:hypothetical protein
MFERIGLTTPPCGVPLSVALNFLHHDRVVNGVEVRGDVTLDEPRCTSPVMVDGVECASAASFWAEAVGVVGELRLVVGVQEHPDHLLEQLVRPRWHPERALLRRVFLLNVDAPRRGPSVPFRANDVDDGVDFLHTHTVHGFSRRSRCKSAFVLRQFSIGGEVQRRVEQLSIHVVQGQPPPASVPNDG